MDLTVDYCTECGYREEALETARFALEEFEAEIDSIRLVPSKGGIFRLSVDGEIIFDLEETDFSKDKIIEAIGERLKA